MLASRIIPTLLCRGRQLVKGSQFKSWRSVGVAMQAAKVHALRGVDELIILDIGATPEGRGPDLDLVRELSEYCFTPLTVGGGVRTVDDVNDLLRAGADKVAVGAASQRRPSFIADCHDRFGCQAIVVSIDVLNNTVASRSGALHYQHDGGFIPPKEWAVGVEELGGGEILLTSIDREGMMSGYDLDLIKAVSEAVKIPVIAHGGCGSYQHMLEAINAGASAVAAGAMFQFTDQTPKGAAEYLQQHGVEVRLETSVHS